MSLWLVFGAMTVLAALLVAWPLLRRPAAPSGRRDYELQVYRAQLEELERERERGLLDAREADAARLEVERRMLAADAASGRAAPRASAAGARWLVAVLIALPLLAAGLYWRSGRPDLPAAPFAGLAARVQPGQDGLPSVETMIARLEQRVNERPEDLAAWTRLGQAYDLAGQYDQSVRAWRRAVALDDGDARLQAGLGEALVMAGGGTVTPAARDSFDRALALDAGDPRARFYRGLGLLQAGDRQGAYDAWAALIESSPGDAPWLPELQRRVASLAGDLGIDRADLPAPVAPVAPEDGASPPGPSAEQMAGAQDMAPEDRDAMIRDMVAGLAARLEDQPDDIDGWRRLGRSYQVLGEPQKAADAYRHVANALPDDLDAQTAYADALLAAAPDGPAVLEQMKRVLALDPQSPLALFYLGEAAATTGDAATARTYWRRLLERIPPDRPERAEIQRMIDQLPAGPGAPAAPSGD